MTAQTLISMPSNLPRVNIYLPQNIKKGLEELAKKNRRTTSNMAAWIIEQAINEAQNKGEIEPITHDH